MQSVTAVDEILDFCGAYTCGNSVDLQWECFYVYSSFVTVNPTTVIGFTVSFYGNSGCCKGLVSLVTRGVSCKDP